MVSFWKSDDDDAEIDPQAVREAARARADAVRRLRADNARMIADLELDHLAVFTLIMSEIVRCGSSPTGVEWLGARTGASSGRVNQAVNLFDRVGLIREVREVSSYAILGAAWSPLVPEQGASGESRVCGWRRFLSPDRVAVHGHRSGETGVGRPFAVPRRECTVRPCLKAPWPSNPLGIPPTHALARASTRSQ